MGNIKQKVQEFKRQNGNENISQRDMIMYLVQRVDELGGQITNGTGKISANRANIQTLYWILGGLTTIALTSVGFIIK